MKRIYIGLVVLVFSVFLFTGVCFAIDTSDVPKGHYKIGISAIGIDHLGDATVYNAAIARVKQLGGVPIAVEAERKDEKMVTDLENLITSGVDGIVVYIGNQQILEPVFKKIHDAGIPITTVSHPSVYSLCNVASNEFTMSTDVVEYMVQDLNYKGKYAFFWAWDGIRLAEIRKHMLDEILIDFPEIKRVGTYPEKIPGTVAAAMSTIESVLMQYPDLSAVYAVWDQPLIGADKAIRAAGKAKQVKCYGIDAPDLLIEMAKPGSSIAGVSSQDYVGTANAAVDMLFRHLAGQKVPRQVLLPTKLVTQANVKDVLKDLGIKPVQ
jgi:ribose transport system substrate-binding protein